MPYGGWSRHPLSLFLAYCVRSRARSFNHKSAELSTRPTYRRLFAVPITGCYDDYVAIHKGEDLILAEQWLHDLPGYRELLRQRISDEQRRRYIREARMKLFYGSTHNQHTADVDNLGREVEGCG